MRTDEEKLQGRLGALTVPSRYDSRQMTAGAMRRKRGGFVKLDRDAWRTLDVLKDGPLRLLMSLIREADWRTQEVHGSLRSLAEFLGVPVGTFHRHLTCLKEAGEVEWSRGRITVIRYAELTGQSVPPADQSVPASEQNTPPAERSPAKTRVKKEEERRSTYDGRRPTTGGEVEARTDAGRGKGGARDRTISQESVTSSSPPTAVQKNEGRLRVPQSWLGTGSWERTITGNCERAGANQDEAEIIGKRLRPRHDARKVEPSKKVVAEELRRVREERAAIDAKLREAERLDAVDALASKLGRPLAEAMRVDSEWKGYDFVADPKAHPETVLHILREEEETLRAYVLYLAAHYPERERRKPDELVSEIERAVLDGTVLVAGEPLSEDLDEAVTDPTPSRQEEIA